GLAFVDAGLADDDPDAAAVELAIGQLHVDHLVAFDLSKADHGGGSEHVQHHFLSGPSLHARGAGEEFGPDDDFDGITGGFSDRAIRVAYDTPGDDVMLGGDLQSTQYIWRRTGGGDAYEYVVFVDLILLQVGPCLDEIVFRVFDGFFDRCIAAGDETDDQVIGYTKGRGAFRSVEDAKTAAGSGADIKETTAAAHFFDNSGCEGLYLRHRFGNGERDGLVFFVDAG